MKTISINLLMIYLTVVLGCSTAGSQAEAKLINKQELNRLIRDVQEAYIRQDNWFEPYAIDFTFGSGTDAGRLQPEDMEKLKFYSYTDGDGEKIFFVPVNGSMADGLCHDGKNIMFRFIKQEIHPRRRIEEPPEAVSYCVYPTDVTDIMDMFCGMGTVEREFPTDKSRGEDGLKENEYVRAAVEMIHGTLKGEGVYGRYDIYKGNIT